MEPDTAPNVVATVVIPAWRLTTELRECLDALEQMIGAPSHEVVVVVNGSDPGVLATAREHPSAPRVVPLPANVGFGWACNAGALAARGRYVVFLNDDAVVDARWLTEMVATAQRHDAVAVAGVLLDPSGRVQEAGASILSTAGTVPHGAGLTPADAAAAGVLREAPIEYGSGASLLVAAETFRALGGFDLQYSPAYYEDVDLQLRLREAGHDVWLAPAARVTHRINSSTADRAYFRTWAASRAGALFVARWDAVLKSFPAAAADVAAVPPVQRGDRAPVGGLDGVLDSGRILDRAARMQAEYSAWLESTVSASGHAEMEAKIDELSAKLHEVSGQNHEHWLRVRELESMGLWSLVRDHRRRRRAQKRG